MRRALLSFSAVVALLAACGGVGSPGDGDGGDAGLQRGDGGCVYPVMGAACGKSDVPCDKGNLCCDGAWTCDTASGKWTKLYGGCACLPPDAGWDAGPFTCGPTATCTASQVCEDHPPGIAYADGGAPPHWYQCTAVPAACADYPTCACVKAAGACSPSQVASCDDANGHVTVHCLGQ